MADIEIINGDFEKELPLHFASNIMAGFPSPADDYSFETLDFNRDMIRHPEATFYGRVKGDSMIEAGICNGDLVVIDRQDKKNLSVANVKTLIHNAMMIHGFSVLSGKLPNKLLNTNDFKELLYYGVANAA